MKSDLMISDLNISGPYCVYDMISGHYVYQYLDRTAPGDIPPDVAILPVIGLRAVRSDTTSVLYIDTEVE